MHNARISHAVDQRNERAPAVRPPDCSVASC
jgi:hypothetical protein